MHAYSFHHSIPSFYSFNQSSSSKSDSLNPKTSWNSSSVMSCQSLSCRGGRTGGDDPISSTSGLRCSCSCSCRRCMSRSRCCCNSCSLKRCGCVSLGALAAMPGSCSWPVSKAYVSSSEIGGVRVRLKLRVRQRQTHRDREIGK